MSQVFMADYPNMTVQRLPGGDGMWTMWRSCGDLPGHRWQKLNTRPGAQTYRVPDARDACHAMELHLVQIWIANSMPLGAWCLIAFVSQGVADGQRLACSAIRGERG